MKKIINGKLYDTETAKEICSWSNVYYSGDFYHTYETIYQKKTGEYFLYGRGGALSQYGESYGSNWIAGETIIPFSLEDFKEWALDKLSADEYIPIFGDVEE